MHEFHYILNNTWNCIEINAIPAYFPYMPSEIITPIDICEIVRIYFGINESDFYGRTRKYEIIFPRHLAIYLIRYFTDKTLEEIGDILHRDHATILNSIKAAQDLIDTEPAIKKNYLDIKQRLGV